LSLFFQTRTIRRELGIPHETLKNRDVFYRAYTDVLVACLRRNTQLPANPEKVGSSNNSANHTPRHGYLPPETRFKATAQAGLSTGSRSHLLHGSLGRRLGPGRPLDRSPVSPCPCRLTVPGGRYPYHGLVWVDSVTTTTKQGRKKPAPFLSIIYYCCQNRNLASTPIVRGRLTTSR